MSIWNFFKRRKTECASPSIEEQTSDETNEHSSKTQTHHKRSLRSAGFVNRALHGQHVTKNRLVGSNDHGNSRYR